MYDDQKLDAKAIRQAIGLKELHIRLINKDVARAMIADSSQSRFDELEAKKAATLAEIERLEAELCKIALAPPRKQKSNKASVTAKHNAQTKEKKRNKNGINR